MERRLTALCVAAVGALVIVGCSDEKAASPTTASSSTTTTTAPPSSAAPAQVVDTTAANAYFNALATRDAATAAANATPGSNAALFARHQLLARELANDAGQAESTSVEPGVSYSVCQSDGACVQYDELVLARSTQQLSSFTIDGVPLAGRIMGPGPVAAANGLDISTVSAYRSTAGHVSLIVEIVNSSDATLRPFGFSATYLPTGATNAVQAGGAWGADSIAPGSTGQMLLSFTDANSSNTPLATLPLGGRISMSGLRSDGLAVTLDVEVPSS